MMLKRFLRIAMIVLFCQSFCIGQTASALETVVEKPAEMTLSGDWTISVKYEGRSIELTVEPAETILVESEKHDAMPLYEEAAAQAWMGRVVPSKTRGGEGVPPEGTLVFDSVVVRDGPGADATTFEVGKDFQIVPAWNSIGRLPEGRIKENQPVWIDYRCGGLRLDSIAQTPDGKIVIRKGTPHVGMPTPPELAENEIRLGNVWLKPNMKKLEESSLFPILETAYPEKKTTAGQSPVEKLLPKALAKLRNGEPIRILAWGDSVTDGGYLPDRNERWQEQFVKRLEGRFPKAKIELITEAWGGRTTTAYFAEPPGSEHNYQEKVLDAKPDLVISEFVNDAGLDSAGFPQRHERILDDFRKIGAEWIILTPHYVKPGWMGLDRERNIDDDPRQYTKDIRRFGGENDIAVADAAARYGRLWRQGIPYSTLMNNNINHPNRRGMAIFVDALMELFPHPQVGLHETDYGYEVTIDGKTFAGYRRDFNGTPILWPVIGPNDKPMTRGFPMSDEIPDERKDHPHHRSIWLTHDGVNGNRHWNDGVIEHREFLKAECDGETAILTTKNHWLDKDSKKPICSDVRTVVFGTIDGLRFIDFDVVLTAEQDKVTIADTKEGTFGIRVPTAMDVDSKKGGTIINAQGDKDDKAWGKRSAWVDYSGPVDAADVESGEIAGIAVFHHPAGFRYPTWWHVRTYGLFAANPFGIKDFDKSLNEDGTVVLKKGESLKFYYRVILHVGGAESLDLAKLYKEYAVLSK